ncbi:hypothetical protein [Sphingobium yanoikuyae]|uniref:hypothetical protein n=1 Tax=Sphingobium yanoikuyae TaxID=13690 RepID=UPI0026EDDBB9|nr:hypothetical protein [Sphingobium yanoikuyae]
MMTLTRPFSQLSGGAIGLCVASIAAAASPAAPPSYGPALIIVLGYELQLLPALLGTLGVIATRWFAPIAAVETRMSDAGRHALTAVMVLLMLALVLSGERRPLVVVGVAGGLGYSGVALFELLAAGVMRAASAAIEIVSRGATSFFNDKGDK